jgi:hypothetical protein
MSRSCRVALSHVVLRVYFCRVEAELARGDARAVVVNGAQDRASPNVMGLASLGLDKWLEIGILCDLLCSVRLLNAILRLEFLGLALSWPQVVKPILTVPGGRPGPPGALK